MNKTENKSMDLPKIMSFITYDEIKSPVVLGDGIIYDEDTVKQLEENNCISHITGNTDYLKFKIRLGKGYKLVDSYTEEPLTDPVFLHTKSHRFTRIINRGSYISEFLNVKTNRLIGNSLINPKGELLFEYNEPNLIYVVQVITLCKVLGVTVKPTEIIQPTWSKKSDKYVKFWDQKIFKNPYVYDIPPIENKIMIKKIIKLPKNLDFYNCKFVNCIIDISSGRNQFNYCDFTNCRIAGKCQGECVSFYGSNFISTEVNISVEKNITWGSCTNDPQELKRRGIINIF